ncbi:hypothetical protein KAJ27_11430 [bacterium]|nr:hypothetical protein [bacterium]
MRKLYILLIGAFILSGTLWPESLFIKQKKFLSTKQKIYLYRITEMIYDEKPMDQIIKIWVKYLGGERNINLHKAGSYIFRRYGDFLVKDIRFLKKKIARLKKFRQNLTKQIERKEELAFLKGIIDDLETRREKVDKDIAYEDRKLTAIFNRNEQKMRNLDYFFTKFRLSYRPIWRHMRELYPDYYFKNPYDDFIKERED